MAITPQTELRIIKCELELDNSNQLTFTNSTAQYNYFNSLPHLTISDISYQRKDNVIRYPAHIDSIIEYNYVMYKNNNYLNKWFYAYITRMEYENDNCTRIYIKTDVFQTWQFDLTYMKSFVEREHVNDDTVGKHTVPENLETGEYISTKLQPTEESLGETCFAIASTIPISNTTYSTFNEILPSGVYYGGFTSLQGVHDYINLIDQQGASDSIVSVFVTLKAFFLEWGSMTGVDGNVSVRVRFDYSKNIEVTKVNYLGNDYSPKNNKLFTYPYSFLQVSNHSGQIATYKWENFNLLSAASDGKVKFTIYGALTPSGSFIAKPTNYNNILNNNDDGIVLGKFPIGGWQNDSYTNWLTQNGINIGIQGIGSAITTAGGLLTGNLIASGGGIAGVANTISQVYQHSLVPPQLGGNTTVGDVMFTLDLIDFEFKRMSIKNEYAKIIDDFFTMYGYKVNTLKVPNITGRSHWNYVKLINPNITAYIPQDDLQEIKGMFSNGITLWHNSNTFLDYSQNNSII